MRFTQTQNNQAEASGLHCNRLELNFSENSLIKLTRFGH